MWATASPFDLGGVFADTWLTFSYVVLLGVGVAQSVVDIRTHRVYVAVTRGAMWWTGTMLAVHAVIVEEVDALVRMTISAVVLWFGFRLIARGNKDGLGKGDVRLAPVIGMALGYLSYGSLVIGVLAMTFIGAMWALLAMLRHGLDARVPYVPAMYGGLLVALIARG
jgi:leader peptidase (prepilin peptidase)/N-methyltransferase